MIDVDEAQRIVLQHVQPGTIVRLALADALHRTLAEPLLCDADFPPFDRALMDGYAVRSSDVRGSPATLRVKGQIAAGMMPTDELQAGEAMQINTGAPIPRGADAVVRVEDTEAIDGGKTIRTQVNSRPGMFVTKRAAFASKSQIVVPAGTRVAPLEIAIAATVGATALTAYAKPRVAILSTGNELVDVSENPRGGQIRNSNEHLLAALVRGAHAEPVALGTARDDLDELVTKIKRGLQHDVLCMTGGVSMGAFDFVPEAAKRCGIEFHVRKMMIKPGRPILFGISADHVLVFALPGNPISAFVGFHLLVKPALSAREGRTNAVPALVRATLHGNMQGNESRRGYWPGRASIGQDGSWTITPLRWQGSGDPFGMMGANALIMRPPFAEAVGEGDAVSVLPLEVPLQVN